MDTEGNACTTADNVEWLRESQPLRSSEDRALCHTELRVRKVSDALPTDEALHQAIVERPHDVAPRYEYAAWLQGQEHELAQRVGRFMEAQLQVAAALRADRRADVAALRTWEPNTTTRYWDLDIVGTSVVLDFRSGRGLRPWLAHNLGLLIADGLVAFPQFFGGCVERVSMRASRFLEIADELFSLAPIRHLALIGVAQVVDQLATSPHLARLRSLSLPRYTDQDSLTDDVLVRLLSSQHLNELAYLRLVQQDRLTMAALEHVVTVLPQLSNFEIHRPAMDPSEHQHLRYEPSDYNRYIARDTTARVVRAKGWIVELERKLGHLPCLHPGDYYRIERGDLVDIEAVTECPIALDPVIMARRGRGQPFFEGVAVDDR